MRKGQNLYQKAKNIIPKGARLLSRHPEMFLPDFRPAFGAIVMKSLRNTDPKPEFLHAIHQTARGNQIPFVIEEITGGFRLCLGSAHLPDTYEPDIAVFAKGISNGFPMAAIKRSKARCRSGFQRLNRCA